MSTDGATSEIRSPVLRFLLFLAWISAGATLIAAITSTGWLSSGVILWPAALFSVGMLLGFLFGVPKVVARQGAVPAPAGGITSQDAPDATSTADADKFSFRPNTNLEEISDWLTKIVVGVTLVELKSATDQLDWLAKIVADSFRGDAAQSHSIGMAIVILFPALGFLVGYVGTRGDLQTMLLGYKAIARSLTIMSGQMDKTERLAEATVSSITTGVGKTITPSPEGRAAEVAAQWNTDTQRGFAGGQDRAGGREIVGRIQPILGGTQAACRVSLTVRSIDANRPLSGSVVFHLHSTFKTPTVTVPVASGVAQLDFISLGVFVVGAEADEGKTRLELDLREVPGGSAAFYKN